MTVLNIFNISTYISLAMQVGSRSLESTNESNSNRITSRKRNIRRVLAISNCLAVVLIFYLVPIAPLGTYGAHSNLPNQIVVRDICHDTLGCPVGLAPIGQSYVSPSYYLFGVGEYLFVNAHTSYFGHLFGKRRLATNRCKTRIKSVKIIYLEAI